MENLLKLNIHDPDATTGSVPLSWCVSPELLQRLADYQVEDPHLLIVAAKVGEEFIPLHIKHEWRMLAPLTDGLAYVSFPTSGPCRIHAIVVGDHKYQENKRQGRQFLLRNRAVWDRQVLDGDGTICDYIHARWDPSYRHYGIIEERTEEDELRGWRAVTASLDVDVPAEVFAKKPWAWEAAWVNAWFNAEPIDQCEFRKRRLWAYSIQPPFMFVNWLIRLMVTLVITLAGFKAGWQCVLHPLDTDIEELIEDLEDDSLYWPKSWNYGWRKFARYGLPFLSPLIFLTTAACAWIFHPSELLDKATLILWVATVTAAVVTMGAVGTPLVMLCLHLGFTVNKWFPGLKRRTENASVDGRANEPVARPNYLEPETVKFLVCVGEGTPRTYSSLPKQRRSVRLWVQATKAKVCKPFAG